MGHVTAVAQSSTAGGLNVLNNIQSKLRELLEELQEEAAPECDNRSLSEAFEEDHEDVFIENDVLVVMQQWGKRARARERER